MHTPVATIAPTPFPTPFPVPVPAQAARARASGSAASARPTGPAAPGGQAAAAGFLRCLARGAVEQARVDGPVTAVRDLVRAETFLRSFRRHLLLRPREARGESYNVGLIMIELLIMRESLLSAGRPRSV